MKCAICGKNIIRADLCNEHNAEYGSCASDRPVWLQEFIQSCKRENEHDQGDFHFSLDYCEEIMTAYPDQRLIGVFKEIYQSQGRPTEEDALNRIDTYDSEGQDPAMIIFSSDIPETYDKNDWEDE